MISICIPVYNFDIRETVENLVEQIQNNQEQCELILIDDASNANFREINESAFSSAKTILLEKNIGRAKIRNLFVKYAQNDYLLYIDGDSKIENPNFLRNYIRFVKELNPKIIYGGRIYTKKYCGKKSNLAFKYGKKRESVPAEIRALNPNYSFQTNNFLIERKLLSDILFDERISDYGHEDTLFGFELKKRNILIHHINNPVINGDIETNEKFLEKTEKSIRNLVHILTFLEKETGFTDNVRLLKTYNRFRQSTIPKFLLHIFTPFQIILRFFLRNGFACLILLDLFKLLYINLQMQNRHQ